MNQVKLRDRSTFTLLSVCVLVTLYINTSYLDPFNLAKFHLLVLLLPIICYFFVKNFGIILKNQFIPMVLAGLFLLSFIPALITQDNLYDFAFGTSGRNLGFLTYLFCVLLMLTMSGSYEISQARLLLIVLVSLSIVQIIYGLMQTNNQDFISWNNPFNPLITTFGNPNYASAFFGTMGTALTVLSVQSWLPLFWRLVTFSSIICVVILLLRSNSIQGLASLSLGVSLLLASFLMYKRKIFGVIFIGFILLVGFFSVLGLLQFGPLSSILYQNSISARGDYWRAGLRMLSDYPVTGVGIERFGDNFLLYRDLAQAQGRNFNTFADNAHSVPIQMFATGGLFLGIAYLLLILLGVVSSYRTLFKSQEFVSIQTLPSLIYLTTLLPCLISIDNIGNMVWTWLSLGAVFSGSSWKIRNEK